jgi:DNA-binding transcriptional ArsR family regulator
MTKKEEIPVIEQAAVFQVFSNPGRILIMKALEDEEMSVGEIAERIGATLQNTSQHLRLMKDKGLVEFRREGQVIYYQIADNELGEMCKTMLHIFAD